MKPRDIARQEGVSYNRVLSVVKDLGIEMNLRPGPKGNDFNKKTTDKIVRAVQGKSRSMPKKLKGVETEEKGDVHVIGD